MTATGDLAGITEYRALLLELEPRAVLREEQAEMYRHAIDVLTDQVPMSDGQREMVGLLGQLVHDWEAEHEEPISATPQEVVASLLEENGLPQSALVPDVFANRHNVSEFLAGRRSISYQRAAKLADFFHVSPAALYPRASVDGAKQAPESRKTGGSPRYPARTASASTGPETVRES
jgi:HTH-type transcriptional regulator/antitoxin HigA